MYTHSCFPPSIAPSLLPCPSPTPVTTHSFAYPSEGPAPPRGPAKARWHSQFVSVSVVSMLAYVRSFPDNQPPAHQSCGASLELLALIKTCWNVPGISRILSSSHRNTHPLALNITRLLKFKHETAVTFDGFWGGWCGGKARLRSRLVDVFILLKKKNVHFIFFTLVTASFRMHSNSLQFLSSLALETKATGTVQGHLTPKCISLTRNIFLVIHSFALKSPL